MISQRDIEKALDFLRDSAEQAAVNRSNRVTVEDYLKVIKAQQMAKYQDLPVNAQERNAYLSMEYITHLEAIKEAIYEDEKLRFLIDAAKCKITAWQTMCKTGVEL
jgi:ABC-type transport system involved in cytochrome c biogenesis ATPase subunit